MRTMILACLLALAPACATTSGPRYVNVAQVRNSISGSIRAGGDDRRVTSMGRVREDAAVVYTTAPGGERHEELWVKRGDHWHLKTTTAMN